MARDILLYDMDNIKEKLVGSYFQELLKKYDFSGQKDLLNTLVAKKAPGAELVTWPSGSGKTSCAIQDHWARIISKNEDLEQLFDFDSYDMVFTKCDPTGPIAQLAGHITGLYLPSSRIRAQKNLRNKQILNWTAETAFGRSAGTTDILSTDSEIMLSILKTEFPEKSDVLSYISNNPTNFTDYEMLNVDKDFGDEWIYKVEPLVIMMGKVYVPHYGHAAYAQSGAKIAEQYGMRVALFIPPTSKVEEYDFKITQMEKQNCVRLSNFWNVNIFYTGFRPLAGGYWSFLKYWEGDFIKLDGGNSIGVLWKDRLPIWFSGTYQELKDNYPDFMKKTESGSENVTKSKKEDNVAQVVNSLHSQHKIQTFISVNTIESDDGVAMSATRVREALVKGNKEELEALLSPELYTSLVTDENIKKVNRRYHLCKSWEGEKEILEEIRNASKQQLEDLKKRDQKTGEVFRDLKGKEAALTMKYINRKDVPLERRKYLLKQLHDYEVGIADIEKWYKEQRDQLEESYKEKLYVKNNLLQFPEIEKDSE